MLDEENERLCTGVLRLRFDELDCEEDEVEEDGTLGTPMAAILAISKFRFGKNQKPGDSPAHTLH